MGHNPLRLQYALQVAPDRSKNSHAFENMIEHLFLSQLLQELWFGRGEVVEVAKADIDAWGYDLILSVQDRIRYVQLKTRVPVVVSQRLLRKPGAWVVAAIPSNGATGFQVSYRLWQAANGDMGADLRPARRTGYRRGETRRDERPGHARVPRSKFTSPMSISGVASCLFPPHRRPCLPAG